MGPSLRLVAGVGLLLSLLIWGINRWLQVDLPLASLSRAVSDVCPRATGDELNYRGLWMTMAEPTLSCGPLDADETYRLTWTQSLLPASPIVIRATRTGRRRRLVTAVFDWTRTSSLQSRLRRERTLSARDWESLSLAIRDTAFWTTPDAMDAVVLDGQMWLVEARVGRRYHAVKSWPAAAHGHAAASVLIRLGGFVDEGI